jgi:hypothetical protein
MSDDHYYEAHNGYARKKRIRAVDILDQVKKQKDAILKSWKDENWELVTRFINDLVSFQRGNSEPVHMLCPPIEVNRN